MSVSTRWETLKSTFFKLNIRILEFKKIENILTHQSSASSLLLKAVLTEKNCMTLLLTLLLTLHFLSPITELS